MINFYIVNEAYIDYLRSFDNNIYYHRIVCGSVFTQNDINYYAPISYDINESVRSFNMHTRLQFNQMFPATESVLTKINKMNNDAIYSIYEYYEERINYFASHARLYGHSCNFQLLDSIYKDFSCNNSQSSIDINIEEELDPKNYLG